MQHIILKLTRKNKKEQEEDFCHENVKKVPFCRRYTNVYYVDLSEKIDVIFKRRRKVAKTIELVAQCLPLLMLFKKR
jgi:hypothetical protein